MKNVHWITAEVINYYSRLSLLHCRNSFQNLISGELLTKPPNLE